MDLLVDIGNSRIKWARFDGGRLHDAAEAPHQGAGIAAAATSAWQQWDRPERVFFSIVADEDRSRSLATWVHRHWRIDARRIRSEREAFGVTNAYPEPGQLGTDRWATLVALRAETDGSACIVDCGTAITVDLLGAAGRHMGGLIVPGLCMMREGLARGTCNIGNMAAEEPLAGDGLLAVSTAEAVLAGTRQAAVAFVDRVISRIGERYGPEIELVITGGDASRLFRWLSASFRHEPLLVLEGLGVIAEASR